MNRKELIGRRIAEARDRTGLSQAVLGQKVGVSSQAISAYETGVREPSVELIAQIADALSVDPAWICGFSELEAPPKGREKMLLTKYRLTDDRGRDSIHRVAESQPDVGRSGDYCSYASRTQS